MSEGLYKMINKKFASLSLSLSAIYTERRSALV